MAIPIYLQQFKAAGIYRVVFDKSTILNQDTQILRLVVGYSEKGPFNIPVYVKDPQVFRQLFGDVSKKLERRGIYFHRLALQMLTKSPIICLNLKKFDGETVGASTISTDFNSKFDPIRTVKLRVEDVYDTTRFWELNADKLNNLPDTKNRPLDGYINIATTGTKSTSATYFIRKASGSKVSQYNITVNDWYSDRQDDMPEYLEPFKNSLLSDFFAEVYVFSGRFTAKQVLASQTLKNYFSVSTDDAEKEAVLNVRPFVLDAFGEPVDTLDTMFNDGTSNALGHYVGCLIPFFKNKQGSYMSLDAVFNADQHIHNMMMSFNVDMLDDGAANIDLSGRSKIPVLDPTDKGDKQHKLTLGNIYGGTAVTSVLGNTNAPVVADKVSFYPNVIDVKFVPDTESSDGHKLYTISAKQAFSTDRRGIYGSLYVSKVEGGDASVPYDATTGTFAIELSQVGLDAAHRVKAKFTFKTKQELLKAAKAFGVPVKFVNVKYDKDTNPNVAPVDNTDIALYDKDGNIVYHSVNLDQKKNTTYFPAGKDPYADINNPFHGPTSVISAITNLKLQNTDSTLVDYLIDDVNDIRVSFVKVRPDVITQYVNEGKFKNSVYGASVSFIDYADDAWEYAKVEINGLKQYAWVNKHDVIDDTLIQVIKEGDCFLGLDGALDNNHDGDYDDKDTDNYYDNVYVTEIGVTDDGRNYIMFSGQPMSGAVADTETNKNDDDGKVTLFNIDSPVDGPKSLKNNGCLIRIDNPLNQEIGTMTPQYLEGYTYKNDRPTSTNMFAKLQWQNFILSALTDYKGLRTGLLNKSEIDYRYVIDTFQSYPTSSLKSVLSYLCREKQSAFCIGNFPAVRDFVKCPYASFTDQNGIFNVKYVVEGNNKRKPSSIKFSLPADNEGASFVAFYSPLKFSDGYIDDVIPSAGLVSNLFIEKYTSRQPYFIVAGPNYGHISAPGLTGPDYRYSNDELQIIEPYGVNCMVYKPNFGTFINANQTAKQTPLSALSRVNVRELVIYLQDEIEKVLQSYQWEFNNTVTRNAILDRANQICSVTQSNGGIEAFRNVMDESNNTNELIENEFAIISTEIEPGFGCGKMVQELTIHRRGVLSASVKDK